MSKYLDQINVKISMDMKMLLDVVCKFETVKQSELVRGWIRDKLNTYTRNPQFKRWLKFHKEEAETVGRLRP